MIATMIILSVNILFVIMVLLLQDMDNSTLLLIVFALAIVLSYIPVYLVNRKTR